VTAPAVDRRIRSLRPPKAKVDANVAQGFLVEQERRPDGKIEQTLTVFLTGGECPFTCSFCDLWRYTIDGPTPAGALPHQLEHVLETRDGAATHRIKLYNASNFFDPRAVPVGDLPAIARLVAPFAGVTVESHASMIGARTLDFAQQISGRLEVAIGLETIHPTALVQTNKRLDLARFDNAANFLLQNDIDLRVFVLLGAPYVPAEESVEWTLRSVEYAEKRGASVVSIIPVRGGNGELERLEVAGDFTPPTLSQLEDALNQGTRFTSCVIAADLWDAEMLAACGSCRSARIERMKRVNLTGIGEPRVSCGTCNAA
jgi:hypothetical protein